MYAVSVTAITQVSIHVNKRNTLVARIYSTIHVHISEHIQYNINDTSLRDLVPLEWYGTFDVTKAMVILRESYIATWELVITRTFS